MFDFNRVRNCEILSIDVYSIFIDGPVIDFVYFELIEGYSFGVGVDDSGENLLVVDKEYINQSIDRTKINYKIEDIRRGDNEIITDIKVSYNEYGDICSILLYFGKCTLKLFCGVDAVIYQIFPVPPDIKP